MPQTTSPDPETGNQDDQRPDWLPERFKSAEELAKSWSEAEKRITELGQDKAALEASVSELAEQFEAFQEQAQQQQAPFDPNSNPIVAGYAQAMDTGDWQAALAYQAQITSEAVKQGISQYAQYQQQQSQPAIEAQYGSAAYLADQALTSKYDDWGDYKAKVADVVKQAPYLVPDDALVNPLATAEALERIYKQVKFDDFASGQSQQQQADAQAAEARRLAELAPNNAGRIQLTGEAAQSEWERVKKAGTGLDAFLSRG